MSAAFNIGLIAGCILSALLIWVVVTDCEGKSPGHICTVHAELNGNGALHFTPAQQVRQ